MTVEVIRVLQMLPSEYDKVMSLRADKRRGVTYFIDFSHPLAQGNGRVYYRRHNASVALGRWLVAGDMIEHIDGDEKNSEVENLRVSTAEGRAEAAERKRSEFFNRHHETTVCLSCEESFVHTKGDPRKYCSEPCFRKGQARFNVTAEELRALVWAHPTVQVAKMLNVSDVAVAKRCKALGVEKPPRGYWAKVQAIL